MDSPFKKLTEDSVAEMLMIEGAQLIKASDVVKRYSNTPGLSSERVTLLRLAAAITRKVANETLEKAYAEVHDADSAGLPS